MTVPSGVPNVKGECSEIGGDGRPGTDSDTTVGAGETLGNVKAGRSTTVAK